MLPGQAIAIVGVGGEFPAAATLERYWQTIVNNVNTAQEPPPGRWLLPLEQVYDPALGQADRVYSRKACFLDPEPDIGANDYGAQLESELLHQLDPMCRLLLRVGHQVGADLNLSEASRQRAGVIIGNLALPSEKSSALSRYLLGQAFVDGFADSVTLPEQPVASVNRYVAGLPASLLARALGFQGSSYTIDAACASSLYAIKLAIDELTSGRADLMLAGGLSRPDSLYTQMGFSQLQALSPSGTCSPFGRQGDGLVVGEGCGLVALKRLEDAERNGDDILAVIRGVGLSNDLAGNLLAPASEGQLRAMRAAYQEAGWAASDVDLIECHATGTPVGDAVEFASLEQLWAEEKWRPGQCAIGSVKANVGHLLTAAGAAALIKVLLAMKHRLLPPMANFTEPAPGIDLDQSPFRILQQPQRWNPGSPDRPRRAAISAFGFGGINAHLLLEEWHSPASRKGRKLTSHPSFSAKMEPIAIVGMGATYGPWPDLDAFRQRLFGDDATRPEPPKHWWDLDNARWFHEQGLKKEQFKGYFLPGVGARAGDFRIPPKELGEMLPRQLLMLKVAAAALADAGIRDQKLLFTGVFIGCGLDLNATNFSFRWAMRSYAEHWARELKLELSNAELDDWVEQLRQSCGPALTANRTMGALGSIVASRIAKEFAIGGPSFTLCAEENSSLRALDVAIRQLQQRSINQALVGAVDLPGDLRNLLARHEDFPDSAEAALKPFQHATDGTLVGEGAGAVILKRLEDARQDGDRIYAVIRGVGSAIDGSMAAARTTAKGYQRSLEQACRAASISPSAIHQAQTQGCGITELDHLEADVISRMCGASRLPRGYYSSTTATVGQAGAATGLAAIIQAALGLHQRLLPGMTRQEPWSAAWQQGERDWTCPPRSHYWLSDRPSGRRNILLAAMGGDASCAHAVLEEAPWEQTDGSIDQPLRPAGSLAEGLLVVTGVDGAAVRQQLAKLGHFWQQHREASPEQLAGAWQSHNPYDPAAARALTLVIANDSDREACLQAADDLLNKSEAGQPPQLEPRWRERLFYSSAPLAKDGKVAFIFPGSGNHFAGMGRDLSAYWPAIYRAQEEQSDYLASQYQPDHFWGEQIDPALYQDHNALVISHVAVCTALSDLVRSFGVEPQLASGYSLGEAAALFSSGAWQDRDGMLQRLSQSTLFTRDLAGECRAARRVWGLPANEPVDWVLGIIDMTAEQVSSRIAEWPHLYLLIVNSYRQTVIGGQRSELEAFVAAEGCHYLPLEGVTTVHCEVVKAVADAYRELHLFPTKAPAGIDFYSCARGGKYPVTRANAADIILQQALATIDYPRVVEQLYRDGARIFIEVGPGSSCSRMIDSILGDRPHLARSFCRPDQSQNGQLLRLLAACLSERVPVDLQRLYPGDVRQLKQPTASPEITPEIGGQAFSVPPIPKSKNPSKTDHLNIKPEVSSCYSQPDSPTAAQPVRPAADSFGEMLATQQSAHAAYLDYAAGIQQALSGAVEQQLLLSRQLLARGLALPLSAAPVATPENPASTSGPEAAFDRDQCLEFAVGRIGQVLGSEFAPIDEHPTRVRLPAEPLMLVDRILSVEGEARSLTQGRVVTEHEVNADRWYLDGGHIPTCVAVEAGQADLFLSAFLGIDFVTKGRAVYRLLDAVVTFHRSLPVPGETIRYDIHIERFFRQDQTYLFQFHFTGTVNGEPLLTMRNGCAGFFSERELQAGRGIVQTRLDRKPLPGTLPDDWRTPVPMQPESYDARQIEALYAGDLAAAFGPGFANLPLNEPYTLPSGHLKLVDRVTRLDPEGGRYGCGQISAEMDIDPDDWFLTCHFVDDMVMPGTLMYECCLHTLRIFLLRMGWIGEVGQTWCEPVPDVASGLKCRGQVIATTRVVTYQVTIKELGYRPQPYAIVDALMFADGHPIVEIPDMSVQLAGLDRERIEQLWNRSTVVATLPQKQQVLFDRERITAFAIGKPSVAFGEPYRVFDEKRQIARLPGPPFQFLDRIVAIDGEPWQLQTGVKITAEYDVPEDAWYFASDRQPEMPFSVLLETGLQPCGWLAAYLGSALTSEVDLSFRNLDGRAVQQRRVMPTSGTLTTDVEITRIASSGGMLIQHYDFAIRDREGPLYSGDTVFGFFTRESLAEQVGIRGAQAYAPGADEMARGEAFAFPREAPFPAEQMRMIDQIELFVADGGSEGLGFIRGTAVVDPEAWFFQAHFYQDPVWPGSLGLESLLQLLKVVAVRRWSATPESRFEAMALGREHRWTYRGQIVPSNQLVRVEATITAIDDSCQRLQADGQLAVDDKIIYRIHDFSLGLSPP